MNIGSICTRRMIVVDCSSTLAQAAGLSGLATVIRSGLELQVAESKGTPPPKPLPLRVPAIGTAGWNTVMA
jgi:hypothetical protein